MSTQTHASHLGLKEISNDEQYIRFQGSLGACKRMAFAHGCEVWADQRRQIETGITSSEITGYFLRDQNDRGSLIIKDREGWVLMLNKETWDNE